MKLGERNTARMPRVYYPLSSILKQPTSEEGYLKEQLDIGIQFFFKRYAKIEYLNEAYEKLQIDLEPFKTKLGLTNKKLLEVLVYYRYFKTHEFIKIEYDFSRFKTDAEVLYEALTMKTLTSKDLDTEQYYNYFG